MKILEGLPEEPLSLAQETTVAMARAHRGTSEHNRRELQEILVLHSMREAFFYARKCCRGGLPDDEIYSLAYSALMRATVPFRSGKRRFFAYAKAAIRGEIFRVWRSKRLVKNTPLEKMMPSVFFEKGCFDLRDAPTREQREAQEEERDPINFKGPIASGKTPSHEPALDEIFAAELGKILNEAALEKLSDKERQVIDLHYKKGLTFREIGETLGMLRKTASAAHQRALKKLRLALERSKKIL